MLRVGYYELVWVCSIWCKLYYIVQLDIDRGIHHYFLCNFLLVRVAIN